MWAFGRCSGHLVSIADDEVKWSAVSFEKIKLEGNGYEVFLPKKNLFDIILKLAHWWNISLLSSHRFKKNTIFQHNKIFVFPPRKNKWSLEGCGENQTNYYNFSSDFHMFATFGKSYPNADPAFIPKPLDFFVPKNHRIMVLFPFHLLVDQKELTLWDARWRKLLVIFVDEKTE